MRVIHKIAAAGATVVALAGIGVGTAMADPYATPAVTDIVGVGSDTTTPIFDGGAGVNAKDPGTFVTDYNTQTTVPANLLWSYDAVGSANITPKPGCASITRPNGSSAGITALTNDKPMSNGDFCIDFARSSRAPKAVVSGTNGPDTFASFAKDAITYSSVSGSANVPAGMTVADLTNIYNCTWTNWDQIPGNSAHNAPIVAVLPQNGSGTRATFLAALGGGVNNPLVPGSCVVNGTSGGLPVEENTGSSSSSYANTTLFTGSSAADIIFPYSVGDYIAQATTNEGTYNGHAIGGHSATDFAHGNLVLQSTTDGTGTLRTPTVINNTAPYSNATVINPSFTSSLQRLLYNVVRNSAPIATPQTAAFPTTPSYEATALPKIFSSTGWICTATAAQQDITSYGFLLLGRNCGALSAGS
jgi:ABC-type phosphate transport system substrate-binding protein